MRQNSEEDLAWRSLAGSNHLNEKWPMNCPQWASTATKEHTKKTSLGSRTFRYSACKRTFKERTGTPFNSLEYPATFVLLVVLWRLRYTWSLRDLAEMFLERGFEFTHEAVRDWEAHMPRSLPINCVPSDVGKQANPAASIRPLSTSKAKCKTEVVCWLLHSQF